MDHCEKVLGGSGLRSTDDFQLCWIRGRMLLLDEDADEV
jgi:hypothetical protein